MNNREWPSQSPGSRPDPFEKAVEEYGLADEVFRAEPPRSRWKHGLIGLFLGLAAFAVAVGVLLLALDQCIR